MPEAIVEMTGYVVGVIAFVVVISIIGAGIGVMPMPDYAHAELSDPGILSMWEWIWATGKFLLLLVTFQLPEIPTWLNMVIVFPMMAGLLYITVRLIKPTGGS